MDKQTYIAGQHNFICDICGFKYKSSDKRITWDNKVVCKWDWEPRHPQDFVRAKHDDQTVENSRPQPDLVFVVSCTNSTAIAGFGQAGCAISGKKEGFDSLPSGTFDNSL